MDEILKGFYDTLCVEKQKVQADRLALDERENKIDELLEVLNKQEQKDNNATVEQISVVENVAEEKQHEENAENNEAVETPSAHCFQPPHY